MVEGNYNDLALCGADDDEDWYSFNVDTLSTVTVAIRFAHAQGDLDLDLFYGEQPDSLNGAMPAGHSVNDDEVVVFENRAPGNYQVRVRSIGQSNVRYSLEVTVEARVFACMDDPDEPNNTFAQATDLGDRVVDPRENQWICERRPIDEDTYYFVVPPGVSRTVAASFLYGDDGDLFLQLFDPDEMALLSTSNIERGNSKQCMLIPASNVARGFYLRVVPRSINSVQQNDERLDYNLTIRPGEDCNTIDPADGPVIAWPILGD